MGVLQSLSNKQVEKDSSDYSSNSDEEEGPKTAMANSKKEEVKAQSSRESEEAESEEEDSSSSDEEDDNSGEGEGSQSESKVENEKSSKEVKDSKKSASNSKVASEKKLCLPLLDTLAADDEESNGSTSESEEGTLTIKTMEIVPKSKTPSKRPVEDNKDVSHETTTRKKLAVSILENSNKVSVTQGKKTVFKRVWSEQDEITILEGMIEYKAATGIEPNANLQDFFDFIKDSLQRACNKVQLTDKIKHLKRKYMRYVKNPQTIREPHGMKVHKLSKRIWGNVRLVISGASSEISAGQEIQENVIPKSKKSELHEMPRELEEQDVELFFQKFNVMIEQARQLVLKSLKK